MRHLLIIAFAVSLNAFPVLARDVFVDNSIGDDRYDGLLDHVTDSTSGPVRTLKRAMEVARFGDQIVLTRPGAVYYDSLSLTGKRHSGSANFPFTINGNGAILSGLRQVPPEGWRKSGPDLWKLTLTRKGYYRLVQDGQPLTEYRRENAADHPFQNLKVGEWTSWEGSLYLKSDEDHPPATQSIYYSAEQTGLSLYQVENVRIVDLTLRDFRFDGLHAQNMCSNVKLENVNCVNNGRAGLAVSGTSHLEMTGGSIQANGRYPILISNKAGIDLQDVSTDGEPTVNP